MPSYPEIRLALATRRRVAKLISQAQPDAIHIATEGPLGWLARSVCMGRGLPFTTSFHTRFPDYIQARIGLDPRHAWAALRRFHRPASAIMVATPRLAAELASHGLHNTRPWTRGVDLAQFHPNGPAHPAFAGLPGPIALHVGRVAVEKNIEAFLSADWHGSKVVVGDGPALDGLQQRYPDAHFLGALHGEALASAYRGADVLAFPSRTDTFGLVMIEALACGTPVAGYPVPGPLDVVGSDGLGTTGTPFACIGAVHEDLTTAMQRALAASRTACAVYGARFAWDASVDQFLAGLAETEVPADLAA
jgi:glycosyltransferase involved in cell wall biosynthesis